MSPSERHAIVFVGKQAAASLRYDGERYSLTYNNGYQGPAISLTLPVQAQPYVFYQFPAFFDGLLPEGPLLEGLLKEAKLDRDDYFGQLVQVGHDMVGAVSVQEVHDV